MPWNKKWDDECHEARIQCVIASTRAMMQRSPSIGAGYLLTREGVAVFQGNDAMMTRASGLGRHRKVTFAEVKAVEDFFCERGGSYSWLSVTSASHSSLEQVLQQCGYSASEPWQIWARATEDRMSGSALSSVIVRQVPVEDAEVWCRIVAAGFHGGVPAQVSPRLVDIFFALGFAEGSQSFLALLNNEPAGGGVISVQGQIASLSTTSVLPQYRRKGCNRP